MYCKMHGRWRSDAVYLYIVDDEEEIVAVSKAILGFDQIAQALSSL